MNTFEFVGKLQQLGVDIHGSANPLVSLEHLENFIDDKNRKQIIEQVRLNLLDKYEQLEELIKEINVIERVPVDIIINHGNDHPHPH